MRSEIDAKVSLFAIRNGLANRTSELTIMSQRIESHARVAASSLGRELSEQTFLFSEQVQDCADMEVLSRATQKAIVIVGMTAVASGLVSGPRLANGDIFHFVNWPAAWLEFYHANSYLDKDPVPRWAMVSGMPISWTELLKHLSHDDPGHEVYTNASRWGFTEGLVTPARGLDGSFGLVSVGGRRVSLQPVEQLFLQSVSVTAFHRAETIANALSSNSDLAFRSLKVREKSTSYYTTAEITPSTLEATVRNMFSLTPAEWRVALALYQGESLQGLAAIRNTSLSTLRVQLARVFEKTRTHRQAELVAVIRSAIDTSTLHERRAQ